MKHVYLGFAILGAIVPYIFFLQFIQANGWDLPGFIRGLFANGAAGGFSADLLVTSLVFWLYMLGEAKSSKGPTPWLFIVLNLTIGLSCAFPAYLYSRETRGIALDSE